MTTITSFDAATCRRLQDLVIQALKPLGLQYGVEFTPAGGTREDIQFIMKIRAKITDQQAVQKEARDKFNSLCAMYDLEPKHFEKVFHHQGKRLQLMGFEPSRSKYPLRIKEADGKIRLYTTLLLPSIQSAP